METTTMTFQCSARLIYKLWELDLIERLEDIFGIDRLPLSILAHIIGPANETTHITIITPKA